MQYEMRISREDIARLQNYANSVSPSEAVALLFGTTAGNKVFVNHIEFMDNESPSKFTSFSVNPESEYKLLLEAEERGDLLVAIFHSHPAPPKPSETDMRNMRLNPVVWLIASKLTGIWIIKGYILQNDEITEVSLCVEESVASNP